MTPILFLVIVLVLVVALAAMVTGIFNKLVTDRNCYKNAFAQIEVQIKRRYDLIPKLVETAKGYMRHERETLEAVISARNQAVGGLQKATQDPGNAEAIRGLADAQRLAREWDTAHPRDSLPSPLNRLPASGRISVYTDKHLVVKAGDGSRPSPSVSSFRIGLPYVSFCPRSRSAFG